jgi:hypothetical protein
VSRDSDQDIAWRSLGVFDEDVPVLVSLEDACIEKLEFGIEARSTAILLIQALIGKFALWILVEKPHVGVRGGIVEVVIELLHVLSVISLWTCKSEQALFEHTVSPIPQSNREA